MCLCGILGKKKSEVKALLSDEVAPAMTVEEIDERDPNREIRGWLQEIGSMARGSERKGFKS
jgi:hypothetical protein